MAIKIEIDRSADLLQTTQIKGEITVSDSDYTSDFDKVCTMRAEDCDTHFEVYLYGYIAPSIVCFASESGAEQGAFPLTLDGRECTLESKQLVIDCVTDWLQACYDQNLSFDYLPAFVEMASMMYLKPKCEAK